MHKCPGRAARLEEDIVDLEPGSSHVNLVGKLRARICSPVTCEVCVDDVRYDAVSQSPGETAEPLFNLGKPLAQIVGAGKKLRRIVVAGAQAVTVAFEAFDGRPVLGFGRREDPGIMVEEDLRLGKCEIRILAGLRLASTVVVASDPRQVPNLLQNADLPTRNVIQENTWKEDPETGTGTLYNLGSHLIDQALHLFGPPLHITADIRIQRKDCKVDDAFTIWMGYDAVRVTLKASYLVREPGPRYQLHGTLGSYLKYGTDPQEEQLKAGMRPTEKDWGKEPETDWGTLNAEVEGKHFKGKYETLRGDYRLYYDNIYSVLREDGDLSVTAREANQVIKVIEAAKESNRCGKRVLFTC